MSLECGISAGIGINCDDLRKPGGLGRSVWLINKADLRNQLPVTSSSYITDIPLTTYQTAYKFEGAKFSHEATWAEQTGDGGNKSYSNTVTLRVINSNPTDDAVLESLSVAEVIAIVQTNAGEFLIYGAENGLSSSDGTTGGAGRQSTDTTATTVVLTGVERYLPKRLLIGGSAQNTQNYLDAITA